MNPLHLNSPRTSIIVLVGMKIKNGCVEARNFGRMSYLTEEHMDIMETNFSDFMVGLNDINMNWYNTKTSRIAAGAISDIINN